MTLLLFLFACWFIIHTLIVLQKGYNDAIAPADCILILGNKVNADGTLSPRLESRVKKGLELFQQNKAPYIVVSGGKRAEGYIEAVEMANYLLAQNVPKEKIILDEKATTTYETMVNFIPIAQKYNFKSTIIVSQPYHIHRSTAMLASLKFPIIYHAHSNYFELMDFVAFGKEFLGYYSFVAYDFFNK